ncbi:hypothetical protein BV898_04939 [Hypsibius exemplaris]|uniref:Homeobox domain-containing protein n=1 Tax=Hypsibius exemplaris TaxID=2072580 RepID=A0A1W0X113_HYPEX|nr:hypothetical protein BV898_04939 [Hypsibius exemplaris]
MQSAQGNRCSVKGCMTNGFSSFIGITWHKFPKAPPTVRKAWGTFCGYYAGWQPTSTSQICSRHFGSSAFSTPFGAAEKVLDSNAIPEFYPPIEDVVPNSCGPEPMQATFNGGKSDEIVVNGNGKRKSAASGSGTKKKKNDNESNAIASPSGLPVVLKQMVDQAQAGGFVASRDTAELLAMARRVFDDSPTSYLILIDCGLPLPTIATLQQLPMTMVEKIRRKHVPKKATANRDEEVTNEMSREVKKDKRGREFLPAEWTQELKEFFDTDQYPDRDEKLAFAKKFGMTETKIDQWFVNQRAQLKRTGRVPSVVTAPPVKTLCFEWENV